MTGPRARKEGEIVRAILDYLALRKDVVAWRVNSGAVTGDYKGKRRFVRFNSMKGMSDIIGWRTGEVYHTGCNLHGYPLTDMTHKLMATRFLAIEVKREGQHPTPAQRSFLDLVNAHGGIGLCATSVDDVIAALGKAP